MAAGIPRPPARAASGAALAGLLVLSAGCGGGSRDELAVVKKGPFEVAHLEDGELAALKTLTLSARVRGQLSFLAKDHYLAKKGDVVVELDKKDREEERRRQTEELAAAEKRLEEAERSLEVEQARLAAEVGKKGAALRLAEVRLQTVRAGAPPEEVRIAEGDLEAAEASLSEAESALADARALLGRGFVKGEELEAADLTRAIRRASREKARMGLELLKAGPSAHELRPAELELEEAGMDLETAERDLRSKVRALRQSVQWEKATVARTREGLRRTEEKIAASTIRAPADGLVLRCKRWHDSAKVDVGSRTWPGIGIVELPDLSVLKVKTQIPESLIRHFSVGDEVGVLIDEAPGRTFPGRIIRIEPWARDKNENLAEADQAREGLSGVRVFGSEVELLERDDGMRLGARARVLFRLKIPDVTYVDKRAVTARRGKMYVKVSENGAVRLRPVVLGDSNDTDVVVLQGLEPGERLLVENRER